MFDDYLKSLRAFSEGAISENAFQDITDSSTPEDLAESDEFFQECVGEMLPLYLQTTYLEENANELENAISESCTRLQNYMVGQGMISEATVTLTQKNNVIHMGKEAQIHRMTKIIALKFARKENSKNYKKYKLGLQIKKINLAAIMKKYGAKAERLAKKAWAQLQRQPQVKSETSRYKRAA